MNKEKPKDKKIIVYNEDCDFYDDALYYIKKFDNKANYKKIKVVYSLGLWYGRKNGVMFFKSLQDAINRASNYTSDLYFKNKNSTLILDDYHHDGCNNFKFYKVINNRVYAIKAGDFYE